MAKTTLCILHKSKMNLEIEAKIKVESLDPVRQRLSALDARLVAELVQNDVYYLDTDKKLSKNRCGLRLRTEITEAKTVWLLTFKGPPQKNPYKSRPEYETHVADAAAMRQILEGLGYHEYRTVAKTRAVWELDGCDVCLDDVPPLGCFVEVEGADEIIIKKVLTQLGLADQPHIAKGYAAMMAEVNEKS